MEIIVRKLGKFKEVRIETDTASVDIGVFDAPECAKLAYKFEEAADELVE